MIALVSLNQLGLKYECMEHYAKGPPKCSDCGCPDLRELQLDHVNGGGQLERNKYSLGRGSGIYYQSLRRRGYPDDLGLEVLCKECHKKRHKLKPRVKLTYTTTLTIEFDYDHPLPDIKELSWSPLWDDEQEEEEEV